MKALAPEHVMQVSATWAWVPLWKEQADAVNRVKTMCAELKIEYTDTTEVALVKVVFSSLGSGHYYLTGTLETWNWNHWRFHGTLPYEQKNALGQEIVRIESDVFTVEHVSASSNAKRMRMNA